MKRHSDINAFYEPLIEFNTRNYSMINDGISYDLIHPKSKKIVKFRKNLAMAEYILDGFIHKITMDDYFHKRPETNCQKLTNWIKERNHGQFLAKETKLLCALSKCRYEEEDKITSCMKEFISKKEEKNKEPQQVERQNTVRSKD